MLKLTDIRHQTTPHVLVTQAERFGDRPFFAMVGEKFATFGEMELATRRLANSLRELGIGPGDRVMLMMANCPEFMETWLALHRLGAVTVTVNTAYRGVFLEHVANNSGARFIVAGAEFVPTIIESEAACGTLKAIICTGNIPPVSTKLELLPYAQLRQGSQAGIDVAVSGSDISTIIYTSGTTGPSKGVLIPHAQLYMNSVVYNGEFGLTAKDRFYSCLPLFHSNALIVQCLSALCLGAPVSVAEIFSASGWLSDIRRSKATVTNLLGVMTEFLVKQPETPQDSDHDLRLVCAVPIAPQFGAMFEARFGAKLRELYGSTEANCPIYSPVVQDRRDNSCGKLVDEWFEARLVDPETDVEVPDGQVGELLLRAKAPSGFMAGYNAMPDETVKSWRNLWFHTGDAMRREDGWFYFVDRIKDCIRRRSENISSFEIEQVIMMHEAVFDVAVIGVVSPFEANEQEVKACVVLKSGQQASARDIYDYCAPLVPRYAIPRFVEIYEELPKTPTNKVKKAELRKHGIREQTWTAPAPQRQRRAERQSQ
jgi:crotonobetaine/carnitine-CoA ligase